jgi:hypothetical protein
VWWWRQWRNRGKRTAGNLDDGDSARSQGVAVTGRVSHAAAAASDDYAGSGAATASGQWHPTEQRR